MRLFDRRFRRVHATGVSSDYAEPEIRAFIDMFEC